MHLEKLIENVEYENTLSEEDLALEIEALVTDSRRQVENGLFFCLTGGTSDGHLYAAEAVRNGCVAVVTERRLALNVAQIPVKSTRKALAEISSVFHGKPSERLKIIGVTGTNGKTTTAYMLASILRNAGKKTGIIGTLGVRYEGKELPSDLTTPDPVELQAILADMRKHGVEYVVMEVSAHALYYDKVEGIVFQACIFTNLTQDHLDFFENMSDYKAAKKKLFEKVRCNLAILNGDDEVGREIAKAREEAGAQSTVYGMQTPTDAFAIVTEESLLGSECVLNIDDRLIRISLAMLGRHNVYNALAAATCAANLGIPMRAIAKGLTELKGVEGRLERVCAYNGADIFVDFAHTPDGLGKSLDALRPHCRGRLVCLFGCGGNRDKTKRPLMGETVAKKSDFAVLTSDNPRYEDPLDIISEIEKGYRRFSVCYVVVPDRRHAIDYALDSLREGDLLLVAGKGGEHYQEIMGIKYPFNDHDIIEKLLEKKGK